MTYRRPIFSFAASLLAFLAFSAQAATLSLTGTVRDFCDPFAAIPVGCTTHSDFEAFLGSDPGIVMPTLGADGKPVYAGTAGNPTTTGATAFSSWFNDTPGINKSALHTIMLADSVAEPGVFKFSDGDFFPVDGLLWGNQGRVHNYGFTYELHTTFTYVAGTTFSFTGDDDVWVFINDKLAIDLGGVHGAASASVSLDAAAAALGISPGGTYSLDLFFAERHTSASSFAITTTLALETAQMPEPGSVALLALGLSGLLLGRRQAHKVTAA